jgi:hypothetical protein
MLERSHRRDWLLSSSSGLGALAFAALGERTAAAEQSARSGHHAGTAKSVIFLFMDGGPSHLDTFDRKPKLNEFAGQTMPASIKRAITPMGVGENPLLACQRKWKQYGEAGIEVSDWYPRVGECADDLCILTSASANVPTIYAS